MKGIVYLSCLLSCCALILKAQSGSVTVTTAAQRTDGSGLVDVYFTLNGTSSTYHISMEASFNAGVTYTPISSSFLSGHIGSISPGTFKYIKWDGLGSFPNIYSTQAKLKIIATASGVPLVYTAGITNIMPTMAVGGGEVTSQGSSAVTARGVCWSTTQNPTIANNFTINGSGIGFFGSSITGLTAGTTYYVRAYATNNAGTAYGNQVQFTTSNLNRPTVTTNDITSITQTTATGGGTVTAQGSAAVTARGICYSTSTNPTTSNSTVPSGSGMGSFIANMSGLSAGTAYYVRAYATNSAGTAYGNQVSFTTLLAPSGNILGHVKDARTNQPIQNVTIKVFGQGANLVVTGSTLANGNYNVVVPQGNGYSVNYTKTGYIPANYYNINVTGNQTTYLEQVLYIDQAYSGNGNISGRLINSMTTQGVPNLTLRLRGGLNNQTGVVVTSTATQSTGNYAFNSIPAGYYTIEATGTGYNTIHFSVICIGGQTTPNQNATITPTLNPGETRIVLTWGQHPSDLDSHLTGPTPTGSRFHVNYFNLNYYYNGVLYANLDVDDVSSYGPETVTIYQQINGVYRYSVHDFTNRNSSNSTVLSNSGAQIKVYRGSSLVASYNVPPSIGGTLWTVFELNGNIITPINTMSYTSNPGNITKNGEIIQTDASLIINLPKK